MIGALLSFSVMAVSIRELSRGGLSIFEILGDPQRRCASRTALFFCSCATTFAPHARPRRMGLNLFRNVVHYASQFSWALSLTMLPLAMVFALEFTMPAWTALLAVWFLHERLTPSRLGVVVLGLVGVLVILRPGIADFNPAAILVLLAAFGYAITMITTKQLTTTETTFGIVFWMAVIQFPLSLIGSNPAVFMHLDDTAYPARNRRRHRRADLALLPEQCIPLRRRHPGGAAGFHAYPADRRGRLGILRRAAGHLRAARRADHCRRSALEPAFRSRTLRNDRKARPGMVFRLECRAMRGSSCKIVAAAMAIGVGLSTANAQSANPACQQA